MRSWLIGLALMTLLAACSGPVGIRTTGHLRIQAVQPDPLACTVRAGDWMVLKGNDFGTQMDWDEGRNWVLFPPGLPADRVELTREKDPATLFFQVPQGAISGTLRVHVEGVGEAEIPIQVTGLAPSMAVPGCEPPLPSIGND